MTTRVMAAPGVDFGFREIGDGLAELVLTDVALRDGQVERERQSDLVLEQHLDGAGLRAVGNRGDDFRDADGLEIPLARHGPEPVAQHRQDVIGVREPAGCAAHCVEQCDAALGRQHRRVAAGSSRVRAAAFPTVRTTGRRARPGQALLRHTVPGECSFSRHSLLVPVHRDFIVFVLPNRRTRLQHRSGRRSKPETLMP